MTYTITNPPVVETDPLVIVRTSAPSDSQYQAEVRRYNGKLARVNIRNGADLALIRMLRHGIDYFAPSTGDGILVNPELLRR
tara:strand:+ start:122 stop:367 length:246 start_codon:yes stop_codon:yes gene_type:complete